MAARKEKLLLMAMTDADCPRFPIHEALMVSLIVCGSNSSSDIHLIRIYQIPLIEMGEELPQIILDIRTSKAINWKTAIVVYDSIFGKFNDSSSGANGLAVFLYSNSIRSRSRYHQPRGECIFRAQK